jgi:hypothetical protein
VLYLALEDGDRRLKDRIGQLLGDSEPIPGLFHYVTRTEPGLILRTIDAFLERHPETGLVVLDTLGKVMPPAVQGETTYQRDYRVGSKLKEVTDRYPGLGLVVVHHDRKAETGDFVDSVSGTNGIAGSADTIAVLSRDRHSDAGLLSVTGRDVLESSYGLTRSSSGHWTLTGGTLESARAAAEQHREAVVLDRRGDRMREIVGFVNGRDATSPKDVSERFGITSKDATQYLGRAVNAGLIDKAARGHYLPLQHRVVSVGLSYSSDDIPTGYDNTTDTTRTLRLLESRLDDTDIHTRTTKESE